MRFERTVLRKFLPLVYFLFIIGLTYSIYQPGLRGGFLFDDYPNLKEMGTFGGVTNLETFNSFVFNGISSPIGRPIALSSFLLDDNTWPSNAFWFKRTNLKFHLLTGIVLCWATLNLMRLFGRKDEEAVWTALISSSIWLLHPYMVSTTLYVVQRMAQLAALFVFAGLAGYFHGRLLCLKGRQRSGYCWMSVSLGLGTLLAFLSKENGALLPLLVIVVESCLPAGISKLNRFWWIIFLGLPTLAIIYKLVGEINFSPGAWPNRPFTQMERLLTEPRIICEYLYQLYIPHIETRGLFQDGYNFSRGLLNPVSTIFALLFVVIILIIALLMRGRYPLWSLSILFYFAGHLLESTVVGLELYFEHRNYLTSAFLFLPIVDSLVQLSMRKQIWIAPLIVFLILSIITFFTWKRTELWSNTKKLEIYWAASTPESPRAQNKLGSFLLEVGNLDGSLDHMNKAIERFPQSSLLTINRLLIEVYVNRAEREDFIKTANLIKSQPFDAQAVVGLRNIVDKVVRAPVRTEYVKNLLELLAIIKDNPNYAKFHLFNKLIPYLNGQLYLALEDYDLAYQQFSIAIPMYDDTDSALSMMAEMANASRPVEAMLLFKQAEMVYKKQPDKYLKRSREYYDAEFIRLRKMLDEGLRDIGINRVVETQER